MHYFPCIFLMFRTGTVRSTVGVLNFVIQDLKVFQTGLHIFSFSTETPKFQEKQQQLRHLEYYVNNS